MGEITFDVLGDVFHFAFCLLESRSIRFFLKGRTLPAWLPGSPALYYHSIGHAACSRLLDFGQSWKPLRVSRTVNQSPLCHVHYFLKLWLGILIFFNFSDNSQRKESSCIWIPPAGRKGAGCTTRLGATGMFDNIQKSESLLPTSAASAAVVTSAVRAGTNFSQEDGSKPCFPVAPCIASRIYTKDLCP